jgi:hypothetical protein
MGWLVVLCMEKYVGTEAVTDDSCIGRPEILLQVVTDRIYLLLERNAPKLTRELSACNVKTTVEDCFAKSCVERSPHPCEVVDGLGH